MLERLRNRWIQLIVVAVVIGGVVGAVGGQFVLPEGDIEQVATALGDRVLVFSPLETGEATGGRYDYGGASDATKDAGKANLPLTAAAAVADGWADPVLCEVGRGRTFRKAGKQDVPYLLIYNVDEELLGIYLFSTTEIVDAPWARMNELVVAGSPVIDGEHWAMLVYFKDPTRACGSS